MNNTKQNVVCVLLVKLTYTLYALNLQSQTFDLDTRKSDNIYGYQLTLCTYIKIQILYIA